MSYCRLCCSCVKKYSSVDIDECRRRMHTCKSEERCVNTEGGFQCHPRDEPTPTCRVGYIYDPSVRACVPDESPQGVCQQGFAFNTVTQRCEGGYSAWQFSNLKPNSLTLSMLDKNSADDILKYFSCFS